MGMIDEFFGAIFGNAPAHSYGPGPKDVQYSYSLNRSGGYTCYRLTPGRGGYMADQWDENSGSWVGVPLRRTDLPPA